MLGGFLLLFAPIPFAIVVLLRLGSNEVNAASRANSTAVPSVIQLWWVLFALLACMPAIITAVILAVRRSRAGRA